MPNWKPIVGLSFTPETFDSYCHSLQWTAWRPSFIVLHNTGAPSLAQRPNGMSEQNIQNLVAYYRDNKKWSAGPHLFVDDKQIWVFTPLTMSGVHSPSWNKVALGVEMLGDYSKESFSDGRGLAVRKNTVAAMATLCAVLGIDPETIRLHREDKLTTHACPGKNVVKEEVIAEVKALIEQRHGGDHVATGN
jgi:N-acetylmuramoyl-L-alanine amidase CwlA